MDSDNYMDVLKQDKYLAIDDQVEYVANLTLAGDHNA